MYSQSFTSYNIDEDSLAYLQHIRNTRGRESPGVYVPNSTSLPLIGIVVGLLILGITFFTTVPSFDDPLQNTLLQAAGILLGGWMLLAGIRVYRLSSSPHYLGHFLYVDAAYWWEVSGTSIEVTSLDRLEEATVTHHLKSDGYSHSTVRIELGDPDTDRSRTKPVKIPSEEKATELVTFLNCLLHLREQLAMQSSPPPSPGAMSVTVRSIMATRENSHLFAITEAQLTSEPVIPTPRLVEDRGSSGWLAYALIVVVPLLLIYPLRQFNIAERDDYLAEHIRLQGMRTSDLRLYLIDGRNTKHRAAFQAALDQRYDQVIQRVKAVSEKLELRESTIALLHALKQRPQPIVTLRVVGRSVAGTTLPENFPQQLRGRIEAALLAGIGADLVAVIELPADADPELPALIDIHYEITPAAKAGEFTIAWTASVRDSGDGQPSTWKTQVDSPAWALQSSLESLAQQTVRQMLGPS